MMKVTEIQGLMDNLKQNFKIVSDVSLWPHRLTIVKFFINFPL